MSYASELALGRRFVESQPLPGPVVFCALSGAHMYGFPSRDSDLDLKGAYLAPTHSLLGLAPEPAAFDHTDWLDGVECDLTTLEIAKSLRLLLRGNGNTLEQIFSPFQVVETAYLEALRALAKLSLSRRFSSHYRGFLRGLRRDFDEQPRPEVKTLLYGYRVAGTGIHLLLEKSVETNLSVLGPRHDLGAEIDALIARKSAGGEHALLTEAEKSHFGAVWDQLDGRLQDALELSALPAELSEEARRAVNDWLVELRIRALDVASR